MTTSPERQLRSVPLAQPDIGPEEIALVNEVLRSDVLAMGPFTEAFESALAARVGRRFGIACSSGTAGLHMAVAALGIGDGDEVITTPFSFIATATSIVACGATPIFVDIDPFDLNIDPLLVEEAITDRTKAVMPVHLYGHPARVTELQ